MRPPGSIALFTHATVADTGEGVAALLDAATQAGIEVRLPRAEAEKHGIEERPGVTVRTELAEDTDLGVVLGGDGTILTALRTCAVRDIPVFSINYGAIGFLSTVDHGELEDGIRRIVAGEFETLAIPALEARIDGGVRLAVNDISFHRRPGMRVADLAYAIGEDEVGRVRCDGLVVSTPAGSTGYNLANGGPVMAWGVEGYVVSFIAPHSLTARSLVVAPNDTLTVHNRSSEDAVDVTVDGRLARELAAGGALEVRFADDRARLAQLPGATFYHRLREKFGRLAF